MRRSCQFPVVSLGAGNCAHGVHIISSDLFHLWEEHVPKHSRIYTDLIPIMEDVVISRYMSDVKDRDPIPVAKEHTVLHERRTTWRPSPGT